MTESDFASILLPFCLLPYCIEKKLQNSNYIIRKVGTKCLNSSTEFAHNLRPHKVALTIWRSLVVYTSKEIHLRATFVVNKHFLMKEFLLRWKLPLQGLQQALWRKIRHPSLLILFLPSLPRPYQSDWQLHWLPCPHLSWQQPQRLYSRSAW